MRTSLRSLLLLGGAIVAGLLSSRAADSSANAPSRPIGLQVTATLPASPSVNRDADIAETFGYLMATKLREQGLRGRIVYVENVKDLVPNIPRLELNLTEWRVDPMGNVDCTFNAKLTTSKGSKSLGLFTGTSMLAWPFESSSAHDAAFEAAASEPVKELLNKMRTSGLMPETGDQTPDNKR